MLSDVWHPQCPPQDSLNEQAFHLRVGRHAAASRHDDGAEPKPTKIDIIDVCPRQKNPDTRPLSARGPLEGHTACAIMNDLRIHANRIEALDVFGGRAG